MTGLYPHARTLHAAGTNGTHPAHRVRSAQRTLPFDRPDGAYFVRLTLAAENAWVFGRLLGSPTQPN